MTSRLEYSVLKYIPSEESGEVLNLGVLFFDESDRFREFRYITSFDRLKAFDDEVNIKFVKGLLEGIESDIKTNSFRKGDFTIDEFVRFYLDKYRFDKIKVMNTEDREDTIDKLTKLYLGLNMNKKERLSSQQTLKILEEIIKQKDTGVEKKKIVIGKYNDRVIYDFSTEKYNIKYLDLNSKQLSRLINNIKMWAWNAEHSNDDKTVLFLYDYMESKENDRDFRIIRDIIEDSNARFVDMNTGVDLIVS